MTNLPCSPGDSVVVAMSGGVDSSVAAYLAAKAGSSVVGVSMQVWDYRQHKGNASRATCCSPADFCDARMVAANLGVPFYVVDFEETFKREVIDNFVRTYEEGRTPNPCVDCNTKVKFRELRDRAKSFDCSYVATGHYARVTKDNAGYRLHRGRDLEKDQSYFLYTCRQSELAETRFPVGEMTKDEVRAIAKEAGLPTASKPESQDICFVAGTVDQFITSIGGKKRPGQMVTKNGEVLGHHDGIHKFTVGQRRGLSIGGTENPLYVVEIDAVTNRVIVGEKKELEKPGFQVEQFHPVSPELVQLTEAGEFPYSFEAIAQVRSRHRGERARIEIHAFNDVRVTWIEQGAVTSPGQAAVFYSLNNDEVLAGGRII